MSGDLSEGNWVEPIVLEGTKFDSHTFHQEFFCPVFNLYKVETEHEALTYANTSDYGHGLTIFSSNP